MTTTKTWTTEDGNPVMENTYRNSDKNRKKQNAVSKNEAG